MCDRRAVDTMCGVRSPGWLDGGCKRCCDGGADKSASIHGRHFTPSAREENRESVRKKGRSDAVGPPFWPVFGSEVEAQAKLHAARRVSAGQMPEVRAAKAGADRTCAIAELRMVKEIVVLPAEIKARFFINGELLEYAEIEVHTSGQVQGVTPHVAKCESPRNGECCRVEGERPKRARFLVRSEAGVGVTHQVGTGASANAIGYASAVSEIRTIGDAERIAGLGDSDAGDLPAAENMVRHACALEERQAINIADSQTVTLVKTGTGPVPSDVVGIHESAVKTIRGIVNRVAVSVRSAESQITHGALRRGLQGIINRIRCILEPSDVPKPEKWTQRVRIVPAGNAEICSCLPGDGHTAWCGEGSAIIVAISADGFARFVRIRRSGH